MAGNKYTPSSQVKKRISDWEGAAMHGSTIDPLSKKKVAKNNSIDNEASLFASKIPEEIREKVLSNQELADNLFSYSYNVGSHNFKKRVVPTLINYYSGKASARDVADTMFASGDSKLRGLQKRRNYERSHVVSALQKNNPIYGAQSSVTPIFTPDALRVDTSYPTYVESTIPVPVMVPDENSFVTAHPQTPEERSAMQFNKRMEDIQRLNRLFDIADIKNIEIPQYTPRTNPYVISSYSEGGKLKKKSWDDLSMEEKSEMIGVAVRQGYTNISDIRDKYNEFAELGSREEAVNTDEQYLTTVEDAPIAPWQLDANEYKSGGSIYIKPSHRGRLTELKKRTGKTEAELYRTGGPAVRKMITFARNSRKWKHGLGGNLFEDGGNEGSPNIFRYDDGRYVYQESPTSEEIIVTPFNTIFSDPSQWTYTDTNGKLYTPRNTQQSYQGEINQGEAGYSISKAIDDYLKEAAYRAKDGTLALQGKYTMPAIAAASVLPLAGEAFAGTSIAGIPATTWADAALTTGFGSHGISHAVKEGGISPITALEIAPLYRPLTVLERIGISKVAPAVESFAERHPALYQYPRYAIGKFKYGFDAELPTLYRKFRNLPNVENGRITISNPNNRFAFDNGFGEESPIITNMTTDAPVRSHGLGDWDRDLTLAFPGKTLLGKKVRSTRPSDTFTYGNNISVPVKDVVGFTGRPKEITFLQNSGIRHISSPETEVFWESGSKDLSNQIRMWRTEHAKRIGHKGINLGKNNEPSGDFRNYAATIENLTRETFKSPTMKDYEFMDYVFRPKYGSQTIPKVENFTIKTFDDYPLLGEWIGNTERRKYLEQPWRWSNLMYDPLTSVENKFRSNLNIGLKPEFKK